MKKKHSWSSSIPKFNREKDLLSILKNPDKIEQLGKLLKSAQEVSDNIQNIKNDKLKNIDELVSFVAANLADDFPHKSTLLEELNKMTERYEERILSDAGISTSTTV